MKKTILVTVAYTIEADTEKVWDSSTGYPTEKFAHAVSEVFKPDLRINGVQMQRYSLQQKVVDGSGMNCCRCAVCGRILTDSEKEHPIRELDTGVTVGKYYLCKMCAGQLKEDIEQNGVEHVVKQFAEKQK